MSPIGTLSTYPLETFRVFDGPIIDVRSPKEFEQGHWPEAINIPLFSNEQREHVGTTYKKKGEKKALILGIKIAKTNVTQINDSFKSLINQQQLRNNIVKSNPLRIYCWRGGMRSKSMGWLASLMGSPSVLLEGGYKSYRHWALNQFKKQWPLRVIAGKTGTRKTDILLHISKSEKKIFVIDLEGLANHRGSSFGALGMMDQPSSQQYENCIAESLNQFTKQQASEIWVEAESSNLGKCRIPHDFFNQMKQAPRIEFLRSKNERIEQLVNIYSCHSKDELIEAVSRIKKRLGSERTIEAISSIENEDWSRACASMLHYYDKCYEYELNKSNKVKSIDLTGLTLEKCTEKIINQVDLN